MGHDCFKGEGFAPLQKNFPHTLNQGGRHIGVHRKPIDAQNIRVWTRKQHAFHLPVAWPFQGLDSLFEGPSRPS